VKEEENNRKTYTQYMLNRNDKYKKYLHINERPG
jgi:hypothetical protein